MPQLMDLPDEILTSICSSICDTDLGTLFGVIYVNKKFHRIASPLLVRHWPSYPRSPNDYPKDRDLPHGLFALHLIRNPDLAKNVKTLTFNNLIPHIDDQPWEPAPGTLDELAAVARQGCPELANDSLWCMGLCGSIVDAVATLLLLLCTDLEKLDFVVPFFVPKQGRDLLILRFVTIALRELGPESPLAHLQHVVLRRYTDEDQMHAHAQCLAPFFHLPNLKTLGFSRFKDELPLQDITEEIDTEEESDTSDDDGWNENEWGEDEWEVDASLDPKNYQTQFPVGTSSIQELMIDSDDLSFSGLFTIIKACRRLKKLKFHARIFGEARSQDELSGTTLREPLLYNAESLEELAVCIDTWGDSSPVQRRHVDGLVRLQECFGHMHRLKHLAIDIILLHARGGNSLTESLLTCLPPSLKHLEFMSKHSQQKSAARGYIKSLNTLLNECGPGGRLCILRTLCISWTFFDESWEGVFNPVQTMAEARGIQFSFHNGGETAKDLGRLISFLPETYSYITEEPQ